MTIDKTRTSNSEQSKLVSGKSSSNYLQASSNLDSDFFGESFSAPSDWSKACVHEECTLHQISPYIGKLKSVIASDLIKTFTSPGDLVVDPFAGSFTVPLEAHLLGRRAFGSDVSPYAYVLGMAKLHAPTSLSSAQKKAKRLIAESKNLPDPDLRSVPSWVRDFFHPRTLKEAIKLADYLLLKEEFFFLACLLGILHHQRPGFLSYPSSHLVPYLRDKKFPRAEFPNLYEYREVEPRLIKKIERVYKRKSTTNTKGVSVHQKEIQGAVFPKKINCIITSPPYMSALDYGRDNRLRLWFINRTDDRAIDQSGSEKLNGFVDLMSTLAQMASSNLVSNGHCVIIVGEQSHRRYKGSPVTITLEAFKEAAPNLQLVRTTIDDIPDIRRARRDCRGVRSEHFLVFKKD